MQVTYQQIADFTGKHKNTIMARLNASTLTCNDLGPGKAKLWDSGDALQVIYEAEFKKNGVPVCDGLDLNQERTRESKERADKLELENAARRKELLPAAAVEKTWAAIVLAAKTKITGLPSKLSAIMSEPEEQRRLFIEAKKLTDEALTDLAKGVNYGE